MTNVYIERDGKRCTVDVRGHAATEPLCAAISCLLYTLDGWLNNATGVRILCERLSPGEARLEWRAENVVAEYDSITLIELMEIGFLQLRETEPEHMTVEIVDDGAEKSEPDADAGF